MKRQYMKKQYMKKRISKRMIYLFCLLQCVCLSSCTAKTEKLTHIDTVMGTIIQQTLYVQHITTEKDAEQLPMEIMDLLQMLERNVLSWREEGSEIYDINHMDLATGEVLSEKMEECITVIGDVWKQSEGAFDVTVGPVTGLWDIDTWAQMVKETNEFSIPTDEDIREALTYTGFERLQIKDNRIYLPAGMMLDLGAVGKGIACDEMLNYFSKNSQVSGAVISVGGSVLTYGQKPDGSSWKVGIQHPRKEGEYIATLQLRGNWCVSTSGDYERYVEKDGIRYHHIMDPHTGYPADSGVISVTIVSESGLLSDALSTACFVLGKERGLALVEKYDAEAYMIDENLEISMTEGMDKLLVLQ